VKDSNLPQQCLLKHLSSAADYKIATLESIDFVVGCFRIRLEESQRAIGISYFGCSFQVNQRYFSFQQTRYFELHLETE